MRAVPDFEKSIHCLAAGVARRLVRAEFKQLAQRSAGDARL